jgi:long-subunit acyl-CoA synthetase (AMP-forming)
VILRSNGVNVYPDEIESELRDDSIKKIKVYEEKQQIVAEIHVVPGTRPDTIRALISKYNNESLEYWKIDSYEIIEYNKKVQLK